MCLVNYTIKKGIFFRMNRPKQCSGVPEYSHLNNYIIRLDILVIKQSVTALLRLCSAGYSQNHPSNAQLLPWLHLVIVRELCDTRDHALLVHEMHWLHFLPSTVSPVLKFKQLYGSSVMFCVLSTTNSLRLQSFTDL